jgi:alpha-L-fucosidase
MEKLRISIAAMLLSGGLFTARAGADETAEYLKAAPELMRKWRMLKFGMFVHWGPSSLSGQEISWSRGGQRRGREGTGDIPVEIYDNLYRSFCPASFDADRWVQTARSAGMRYLVFTAKHHDGFCMFDSALTDYKVTNSPYGKDIVKMVADACHRAGIKFGIYYSQPDWHHPDYRTANHRMYIEYMHGQLRELCGNYGRIDMVWFDGLGGEAGDWDSKRLFETIRRLQPDAVINNRAGLPGDYDTPEQRVGEFRPDRPWETCMTVGEQWSWRPQDRVKPLVACIRLLVSTAGGDGNFLFNVGPMPAGFIEPAQAQVLGEMGGWLDRYGQSVYETRGGPFRGGTWGASTHRDRTVYLHFFNLHGRDFRLPPIPAKITGSSVLTGGQAGIEQSADGIVVTVPVSFRDKIDTIVAVELDAEAGAIEPVDVPSGSLALGCKAVSSGVYKDRASNAADKAFDDDLSTHWRSDTNSGWLEVELAAPKKVATAVIRQAKDYFGAGEFELVYMKGDSWNSLVKGRSLGHWGVLTFDAVTAQKFRLAVRREDRQVMISEFQLFGPDCE